MNLFTGKVFGDDDDSSSRIQRQATPLRSLQCLTGPATSLAEGAQRQRDHANAYSAFNSCSIWRDPFWEYPGPSPTRSVNAQANAYSASRTFSMSSEPRDGGAEGIASCLAQ